MHREMERQVTDFKERVRRHADQSMQEFEAKAKRDALGNASQAFADLSKALSKTRSEVCSPAWHQPCIMRTSFFRMPSLVSGG